MKICIIGTGPAGLMAGYQLLKRGMEVQFYDQKKVAGRKFLVAGNGGFNLTHSKKLDEFIPNYNHIKIQQAVLEFNNHATIQWLQEIGIPTFVGSSGKIFPQKGIKPIEVLDAWLTKIEGLGGTFHFEHRFIDWGESFAQFEVKNQNVTVYYDKIIFGLGGASWKKTGSDGGWTTAFVKNGIQLIPFQASNAGMNSESVTKELEGLILKNCRVTLGSESILGEVLFTAYGLEGSPIYALNDSFRRGHKKLKIHLKPCVDNRQILDVLSNTELNRSQQLKKLKIPSAVINLFKSKLTKEEYLSNQHLLEIITSLTFNIQSLRPIDEAISSVGGVSMNDVNDSFKLVHHSNHYAIGEMLDWDAPTGGYLLQACFSMGAKVAKSI